ncbi:hypothetical protein T12_5967 [Trichinella patagoniensis]|uniref:Uncharacterized protein n=1 Tax=Trichinella patagoniensis TaxID=990121 RepID=A0A0V0ZC57_9BILA|nr:hypothetical protein T12_5967 [Trichinella patagoniensis]
MCYRKLLRQRNNHLPHLHLSFASLSGGIELLARSASATVESSINSTRYCFILSSRSETNEAIEFRRYHSGTPCQSRTSDLWIIFGTRGRSRAIRLGHEAVLRRRMGGTSAGSQSTEADVGSGDERKCRVVFDAAALYDGTTLNSQLEAVRNLQIDLLRAILRFHRLCVGLQADIEKMYLQIRVREEDRDACRFLWWDDEWRIRRYRLTRVSSAPRAAEEVLHNMYMDDLATSCDSLEEAQTLMDQLDCMEHHSTELVPEMSTVGVLQALQRFMARRGRPSGGRPARAMPPRRGGGTLPRHGSGPQLRRLPDPSPSSWCWSQHASGMGERVPHPGGGCSGRNETDLVGVTHPWAGADLARQGLLTPQRRQRTNQRPGNAFIMNR